MTLHEILTSDESAPKGPGLKLQIYKGCMFWSFHAPVESTPRSQSRKSRRSLYLAWSKPSGERGASTEHDINPNDLSELE